MSLSAAEAASARVKPHLSLAPTSAVDNGEKFTPLETTFVPLGHEKSKSLGAATAAPGGGLASESPGPATAAAHGGQKTRGQVRATTARSATKALGQSGGVMERHQARDLKTESMDQAPAHTVAQEYRSLDPRSESRVGDPAPVTIQGDKESTPGSAAAVVQKSKLIGQTFTEPKVDGESLSPPGAADSGSVEDGDDTEGEPASPGSLPWYRRLWRWLFSEKLLHSDIRYST